MAAYVIVDTKIRDRETYESYKARAKPLAERHGGRDAHRRGRSLDSRPAGDPALPQPGKRRGVSRRSQ